jgi:hypothetical protein
MLCNDENIDRHAETAKDAPQPYGLLHRVIDRWLDDQHVDVGVFIFLASGPGAGEHNARFAGVAAASRRPISSTSTSSDTRSQYRRIQTGLKSRGHADSYAGREGCWQTARLLLGLSTWGICSCSTCRTTSWPGSSAWRREMGPR